MILLLSMSISMITITIIQRPAVTAQIKTTQ